MGLKVIGAGFGRTGTTSLKVALDYLGLGRTYHMVTVMTNPIRMLQWARVIEGENPNWYKTQVTWDTLFKGFQSAVDWPTAVYYKELASTYPYAKVILTVRDPEKWHASITTTIYPLGKKFGEMTRFFPIFRPFYEALDTAIWEGIFDGRIHDKDFAIEIFNKHIEQVREAIPQDRLLVFDVRQGWEPLCAFLDLPVPEYRPFPHSNEGDKVRLLLKLLALLPWGILAGFIALVVFLLWFFS